MSQLEDNLQNLLRGTIPSIPKASAQVLAIGLMKMFGGNLQDAKQEASTTTPSEAKSTEEEESTSTVISSSLSGLGVLSGELEILATTITRVKELLRLSYKSAAAVGINGPGAVESSDYVNWNGYRWEWACSHSKGNVRFPTTFEPLFAPCCSVCTASLRRKTG